MIDTFPFAGYTVAVYGLDPAGLTTARAMSRSEVPVWAWDDDAAARAAAAEWEIPLVNLHLCDWREPVSLVLGDGVPPGGPVEQLARAAGCEVIGDVEVLARCQRDAAFIGVAGDTGRETGAALVGHVLRLAGREEEVGGLPGQSALGLYPLGPGQTYVLAMSGAQLQRTVSITFDVGVLLGIGDDAGLGDSAKWLFHRQTAPRAAVVSVDDPAARALCDTLMAGGEQRVVPVSARGPVAGGVYVRDGALVDDSEGGAVPVMDLGEHETLAGEGDWRAAAAAFAAARAVGVAPPVAMACIRSFPGLQAFLDD
ncbi:MAG: hypothetical protein H6907_08750 [Hyphomicrobiales bacterium]|nr:hypothetical protein [Hyphomicrobiales bacterium]MCP5371806.1 hypothetical protein [Hyphomicrobiales bacterium]